MCEENQHNNKLNMAHWGRIIGNLNLYVTCKRLFASLLIDKNITKNARILVSALASLCLWIWPFVLGNAYYLSLLVSLTLETEYLVLGNYRNL